MDETLWPNHPSTGEQGKPYDAPRLLPCTYDSMLCYNPLRGLVRHNFRARYDVRLTLEEYMYVQLLGVELV